MAVNEGYMNRERWESSQHNFKVKTNQEKLHLRPHKIFLQTQEEPNIQVQSTTIP